MARRRPLGGFYVQVSRLGIQLSQLLQLYRCHVIYDKNYKVTAFPCLVYLISMCMCLSPAQAGGVALG